MIIRQLTVLLLCCSKLLTAQQSAFDVNNENWRASGDPVATDAAWQAAGGNPGGYIRVTDASIGGTWYFEAPGRFRGNKCDAYDRYLRWDQFTSDTTNQQVFGGDPDVVLEGAGLHLVFDNAQNPGLAWKHFDIHLREDAGWRLGNTGGLAPTAAEFRAVLANITALRIRGEYRAQADFGGLDNFVLESTFLFDLDGDDNSGATDGGFAADTLCDPLSPVVDLDARLESEQRIDSIVLRLLLAQDPLTESLSAGPHPPSLSVQQHAPGWLTLVNNGAGAPADFLAALLTVRYAGNSPNPKRGERLVGQRVFTECGDMGLRYAYLPVFPPGDTGMSADTTLCAGTPPVNLFAALGSAAEPGGYWQPALAGNRFDPNADAPGLYRYILPGAGRCPGDTASVGVAVEYGFQLRADTTICYGDTLRLQVPAGLGSWYWGDGSTAATRDIAAPGTYVLSGQTAHCTFADTVQIAFFTCEPCPIYAPNVFSPNADGWNDHWQVYLGCAWLRFRLEVFDRWGNRIYIAESPEKTWDGSWNGSVLPSGVYVWRLEWEGDLLGERQVFRQKGDVTILR